MENRIYEQLLQIAEDKNIEVVDDYIFNSSINGMYGQIEDTQVIALDRNLVDNPEKRNYILAHELGHAALHKGKINDTLYFNNKDYRDIFEDEADNYAYTLIDTIKNKISH